MTDHSGEPCCCKRTTAALLRRLADELDPLGEVRKGKPERVPDGKGFYGPSQPSGGARPPREQVSTAHGRSMSLGRWSPPFPDARWHE